MAGPSVTSIGAFALAITLALWGFGAAGQEPAPPTPPPDVVVVRQVPVAPPPPPPHQALGSFTFSVGYARVDTSGDGSFDGVDGYYFDSDFAFRSDPASPLWFGFSLSGSYFYEEEDTNIGSAGFPTEVELDAALSTFSIEPRLTFVLLPRKERGPYVAAKLGAGLLIVDYWATTIVERPGGFFIDSDGDTGFAFEVRPGVQLGYSGGKWALGAEVSEMWAWGDFDQLGDQLNELRVGFFFTTRY